MSVRYLSANVTMSAGWRQGPAAVPAEFHHRPRYFVQHMMAADVKSQDISADMVEASTDNSYVVKSASTSEWYTVNVGDDVTQPFCSCRQFIKQRVPCKHFFAIFRHIPDVSFASLPTHYRDNPLFVADDECLSASAAVRAESGASISAAADSPVDLLEAVPDDDDTEVPEREKLRDRLARECRELTSLIVNYTYDVVSTDSLERVKVVLADAVAMLQSVCPATGSLPLHTATEHAMHVDAPGLRAAEVIGN